MEVEVRGMRFKFERGFVVSVTCSSADWLAHGPEIRLCQPVERVRLTEIDCPISGPRRPKQIDGGTIFYFGERKVFLPNELLGKGEKPLLEAAFPGITFELPTDRPDEDELTPGHRTTRGG